MKEEIILLPLDFINDQVRAMKGEIPKKKGKINLFYKEIRFDNVGHLQDLYAAKMCLRVVWKDVNKKKLCV